MKRQLRAHERARKDGDMRLLWLIASALVIVLWADSQAHAQAQNQAKARRVPKVIQLEEIKIEGRVQKPNAFYILNRSNLGYEVLDLRTSFVQNVVRSVQSDAF